MSEYIEITREAFKALVSINDKCFKIDQGQSYCKFYYKSHGVTLLQIDNYNAFCTQYYIQDINA